MRLTTPGTAGSSRVLWFAILLAFVFTFGQTIKAQQFFGSIVGTVTDNSGAIVPGATVTITNKATNEKHTTTSSGAGEFSFVDLVPATYSVTVERANFKRYIRDTVPVAVNNTSRVEAKLEVGAVTETVEVSTTQAQLQTDSGTVSNKVEAQQMDELPLNGRNVMQLLNITPGVIPSSAVEQGATLAQNNGTSTNPLSWGGGSSVYTINGGDNEEYIDGAPINVLQGSNIGLMPTADDVQEFNIDTSAGGADEGRATGGVINETTKSGTNRFHATAYEYFRNADLNANNFFNKQTVSALYPHGQPTPKFNQNLYGFNLGFPIKRDKIFFFGSYEANTSLTQAPTASNSPSDGNGYSSTGGPDIYDGVFNRQIVDPLAATDGCVITHDAIAQTWTLGSTCIDPTAKILRTFWAQKPNSGLTGSNYFVNMSAGDFAPEMNARADWEVSPKQRVFFHTAFWAPDDKPVIPYPHPDVASGLPGGKPWGLGLTVGGFNSNLYILGDTYTINPKTVVDLRAIYLRFRYSMVPYVSNFDVSGLGPNWAQFNSYIPQGQRHLPAPNMTTGQSGSIENLAPYNFPFGFSTGGQGQIWDNYGLNGSITRVFGKHNLKAGFEARLMDMEVLPNGYNSGNPSFGINYSNANCPSGQQCGDEWAELLMGDFVGVSVNGSLNGTEFNWYQAYYAQDTFQATRNLTLNLGVRWELPGGLFEKKDSTFILLPKTTDPKSGALGTEALVNTAAAPSRSIFPIKHDLIDPRLGFAYRLGDKTVVRGGFGITTVAVDEDGGGNGSAGNSVNSQTLAFTNPTGGSAKPTYTLSNPIPSSIINSVYVPRLGRSNPAFLQELAQAAQTTGGTGLNAFYNNERLPYFEQYNFAVQRAVGNSFLATVSYVGSHALFLKAPNGVSIDQIPASAYTVSGTGASETAVAATGPYAGMSLTANVPTTGMVNGIASTGVFCTPGLTSTPTAFNSATPNAYNGFCNNNVKVGRTLEPYPNYSNAQIGNLAYANQHYNALQATTTWRIPGGGLIGSAFTWAKTIGDNVSAQNYYNHRADRTVEGVPMRLAINFNYPLPIGKGQRFLNIGGPISPIISGWAINDVSSFQHGGYLSITSNSSNQLKSNFNAGSTRAYKIPGCNPVIKGSATSRLNQWFNTACFAGVNQNVGGTVYMGGYDFGNEPANDPHLFAQGIDNSDISLAKTTKVTERLNVVFRMETFNTFNRFQAGNPASLAAGNGNFGKITAIANNPRQVQLSLRVTY